MFVFIFQLCGAVIGTRIRVENLFFTEICFVYRALSATISCERFGADAFFMSHSSSDLYEKINIEVPGIKTAF